MYFCCHKKVYSSDDSGVTNKYDLSQLIRENELSQLIRVCYPKPLCWSRYCGPSNFTFVKSLSDTKTSVLVPELVTNKCCCVTNKSNILENMGTGTWYWQRCCEACISVSNRFPICLGAHPAYFHAFGDPETPNVTNKYMSQINTCYCQTISQFEYS